MKMNWKLATITVTGLFAGYVAVTNVGFASADQPQMHEALAALKNARAHLERAAHDHGGHRVKAVEATNAAIKETEAGIEWARQHPGGH